ncbi:hypothetical protein WT10_10305 [Burkholderia stagnalis]|uniref:hypothetical protein n=1 Tax=Burkholderia stagnalis TaxID=1503054 RepID=UPI00075A0E99|nr:hypothetical protein [Burkholderia stagnalis]KVC58898.1 hypothetical protein WS59_20455 [Burkholderia stagnalis]KVN21747.1 hypothetical protein WT10_10305 [Burkholderia stagnalis]
MNNTLKLRVMFDMIDNMTKPLKALLAGNKGLATSVKEARRELAEMGKTQKSIAEFRQMRSGLAATASKLDAARGRVAALAGSLRAFGPPSREMIDAFEKAKQKAASLSAEHEKQASRVRALREQLAGAGVNTRNLSQHERDLRANIRSTTAAMGDQMRRLEALAEREKRVAAARTKMQGMQSVAAGMAIGGYAAKGAGTRILGGMGGALDEAKEYQQQTSQFRSLGIGESKLNEAISYANSIDVKGLSKLDKLKLLKETYTITRDMHHAEEMAPILARMKVGIESVMARRGHGEGHGEVAEQMLMDLVKTTELRGSLKSPEAFRQAVDNATKAYVASSGTVKPEDFLNAIKTGGIAAKQLGDNSFYFGLLHTMQEMGGFRTGTGLMSAYTNWAQGRTTQQTAEDLMASGLLKKGSVKYGKTGHITKMLPDAMKQIELYKTDPFEYLMKVVIPNIDPHGKLTDQQMLSKIGQKFSSRKGGDLFSSLYLERANIEKHRANAPKANGVDALYAEGMGIAYGKEMDALAKKATLEQEIGEKILPLYNQGLEITAKLLERVSGWMERNKETARVLVVSLAALGVVLAVGGALTLGLAAIIGPLALVRFGMSMLGKEGGLLESGIGRGAGAFRRLSSAASGAAAATRNGATRARAALSATWQASSPSAASASLRGYVRSLGQRVPAACQAAREAVKKWGVSAATALKDGISAARQYTVQLWRAVAAQAAATRAAAASRWTAATQYVARRGAPGVAVDAAKGGFNLIKGGAASAISGVASALGGLGQTLMFVGRLALTNPIGLVITGIALAALLIVRYWEPIKAFFSGFWQGLTEGLKPLAPLFSRVFGILGTVFEPLKPVFDWLVDAVKSVWKWITRLLGPVDTSKESLDAATNAGKGFGAWLANIIVVAAEAAGRFVEFGANIMSGLVNGIKNGLGSVKDAITNVADSTVSWFKEKLGIHSPSRVFGELGGFIGQGAAIGMDGEQGRVAKAAVGLATVAVSAFSGPATAAAVPLVRSTVPIDTRPPITSAPAAGSAAAGGVGSITINIYPAPGADPSAIAQAVRAELDRRERSKQARIGARLSD